MAESDGAWTQVEAVLDKPGVELYRVTLTVRAHKEEGGQWAAWCEELNVHTCGDSLDEAAENVVEATMCYLNAIEDIGERRRIFDERGITPELWVPEGEKDEPEVPTNVRPGEYVTHLIAASDRDHFQLTG